MLFSYRIVTHDFFFRSLLSKPNHSLFRCCLVFFSPSLLFYVMTNYFFHVFSLLSPFFCFSFFLLSHLFIFFFLSFSGVYFRIISLMSLPEFSSSHSNSLFPFLLVLTISLSFYFCLNSTLRFLAFSQLSLTFILTLYLRFSFLSSIIHFFYLSLFLSILFIFTIYHTFSLNFVLQFLSFLTSLLSF